MSIVDFPEGRVLPDEYLCLTANGWVPNTLERLTLIRHKTAATLTECLELVLEQTHADYINLLGSGTLDLLVLEYRQDEVDFYVVFTPQAEI